MMGLKIFLLLIISSVCFAEEVEDYVVKKWGKMSDSIVPMINTKLLYKRSDESYVSLNETFTFPQVMLKLRHKFATKF